MTYTTGQVSRIFGDDFSSRALIRLDENGLFRSAYYFDKAAPGRVVARASAAEDATSQSDASRRRYSYQDLVWLALLRYVNNALGNQMPAVPNSMRRAAEIVQQIRSTTGGRCPSSSRLIFVGKVAYLLGDDERLTCLSGPSAGQVALSAVLLEAVDAEVRGRIAVLANLDEVPPTAAAAGGVEQ